MSYICNTCGKTFATRGNLQRHIKNSHQESNTGHVSPVIIGATVMQHPFTCIVAGCTQSGKTVWVKTLLENAKTTINPPPERIIWCYGQWQPMYLEMIKTIPGIEFYEGIPSDIDSDNFLEVSQRNLIVLDDLMAQSGGDKRIASLFTKGSHHRNLSVIYIVQNIFHHGKETRNISLNAHYIVLFKSPRDKQQISVLARQVNPGHVHEFMKSYEEATSRPHGYLMLDLKPTTDDDHRLKTNVLPGENSSSLQQQLGSFIQKQSYQLPPIVNAMYNTEQKMQDIVQAPQLTPEEKSILYSNQLGRFLTFQNQLQNQSQPLTNLQTQQNTPNLTPEIKQETDDLPWGFSATPKTYFVTPPPKVAQPTLKHNFFHNWESSSDWKESDLAKMSPGEREEYEHHLMMTRSKYLPMTKEDVSQLSSEDKRDYHATFKIKTPKYNLRSRPY